MRALVRRFRALIVTMIVLAPLGAVAAEGNEGKVPKPLEERDLWRLEWANDAFVRVDNAFTNGWSIQRHSHQHDAWTQTGPSKFSAWINRTIPGLGDGGDRIVKRGTGLSQVMMTPEDISNPDPQPGDVPWAGSLGWSESWYAFNNTTLNAFQIYAGILGPYSFAEEFQIQIHDWINADEPLGWDNQLKTEPLLNLNYVYKRKVFTHGQYNNGFASDVALGGEGGLGNFMTFARASLEWRFGWGMPKGFIQTADPAGYGIMLNTNEGAPGRFCLYFSIVARLSALAYTVFWDGNTFTESPHPGLPYDTVNRGAVFGLHIASGRYSMHFNFYSYNELPFESVNPVTDLSWGNITFEYRF
jgi:lipid A 3-O-deacylase